MTQHPLANAVPGYRILSEIGRGNNGVVYLARQLALDREVALKILMKERAEEDSGYIRNFLHEARLAARLDHPHIVQALDAGGHQGIYYFAMEYVPGESLEQLRLRTEGKIPLRQVLILLLQLADALNYAWNAHRMTHGDIKPGNLLLRDNDTNLKLADLGLARVSSGAEDEDIMATPMYAAPEVIMGENLHDPRSDIYSFGVMFYELVTGRPPFRGDTDTLLRKHLDETPLSPLEIDPVCDREISAFILRLLAKKPQERCEGWADVLAFLNATQERLFPESRQTLTIQPEKPHRATNHGIDRLLASPWLLLGAVSAGSIVLFVVGMLIFFGIRMTQPVKPEPVILVAPAVEVIEAPKPEPKPVAPIPAPKPIPVPIVPVEKPAPKPVAPVPVPKPKPLPVVPMVKPEPKPVVAVEPKPEPEPRMVIAPLPETPPPPPPPEHRKTAFEPPVDRIELQRNIRYGTRLIAHLDRNFSIAWKKTACETLVETYYVLGQLATVGFPYKTVERFDPFLRTPNAEWQDNALYTGTIRISPETPPELLANALGHGFANLLESRGTIAPEWRNAVAGAIGYFAALRTDPSAAKPENQLLERCNYSMGEMVLLLKKGVLKTSTP